MSDSNPTINGIAEASKSETAEQPKLQPLDAKQQGRKQPQEPRDAKTSNAGLKKKAKEEKAARRAKEKQGKPGAPPDTSLAASGPPDATTSNVKPSAPKPAVQGSKQQKRRDSASANPPKTLPIRTAEPQAAVAPAPIPKEKTKRVACFSHLYGPPRRTTIAGAGKDVHPAVLSLGVQISSYTICGSNARCVAMLLAFKRVIEAYTTPPGNSLPRHLTSYLSPQIEYIISCRPLSVSMGNAIRWLKVKISEIDPDTIETIAKTDLCEGIDNFITERITVADQVIASKSAEQIRNGDTVLAYGRSSAVQKTLEEALRQGKSFRVIVIDSRPLCEGKVLASDLADAGLEVQYSLLHGLSHLIKDATKVLLGAHAMLSNGRLYSRAGTALVAMMAKEHNVPVIVCCESVKFRERVALDSIAMNEIAPPDELILQQKTPSRLSNWMDTPNLQMLNLMYDLTPADCIDMVITEYGSLPPSSVPVVHALSIAG